MAVTSGNFYLNEAQMQGNVDYIYHDMTAHGWSVNAIAGMLGNMEKESTINPGIWQGLKEGNMDGGFGLVQWTPASKYINWADETGFADYTDIGPNVSRIYWELENNEQYYRTNAYPLTFSEFKVSTLSPSYLARAFCFNYERPDTPDVASRERYANKWYEYMTGEIPPDPPDPPGPIVRDKPWKFIFYLRRF